MTKRIGVLHAWNFERGFGFIYERVLLSSGQVILKSHFAHVTSIESGEPIVNCPVHFDVGPGKKGDQAIDVEFLPLEETSAVKESSNG